MILFFMDNLLKILWLFALVSSGCSHQSYQSTCTSNTRQLAGGSMIKGIAVTYIHTPNKKLADWYENTLGLKKGYGDETWQAFDTAQGSTFALDFVSYPSSTVQKQAIMISFAVDDINAAVEELAKKGVRFYPDNDKSKTIFDAGPSLVATFEDPDGNFVQISQKKKWD